MVHYTSSLVAAVIAASSVESFTVVPHFNKKSSTSLWTVNHHFQPNDAVQDFFTASKKTFEFLNNVQQEASSLNKEFTKVKQTLLQNNPELRHASDVLDSMVKQQFNNLQKEYQMKDLLEIVNQIKVRDYTREVEVIDEVIRLLQRAQDNLKEKDRSSSSDSTYNEFEKHQLDDWDKRLMEYKFDPKAQLNDFDNRLNAQKTVITSTASLKEETPTVNTKFHYSPPKTYVMADKVSKPKPLNAPLATKKPMFLLPECKVQLKQHSDVDVPRSKNMFLLPESKHDIVPSLTFEGDKQVEQLFTITSFVDVQEDLNDLPPLEPIEFENEHVNNKLSEDQVIDIVCEVIETLEVQHSLRNGGFDPNQTMDAHLQEPIVDKKHNYEVNHSLRVEPSIANLDIDKEEEFVVEKKSSFEVNHSMREQSSITEVELVDEKVEMQQVEKQSITEVNQSLRVEDTSNDEKVEAPKSEIKGTSEVKHSLRVEPSPKKADSKEVKSTLRVDQRIASMIEEKTNDYEKVDTVRSNHNRDVIRKLQKKQMADRQAEGEKEMEVKGELKKSSEVKADSLQDNPSMPSYPVEKKREEEKHEVVSEIIDAKIEKKQEVVAPAYPEHSKEFKKEVIKAPTSQSENEFKTVTMNKMGAPSKPSYEGKIESLSEEDLAGPDVLRSNNMNRRTHEMRHVLAPREPKRVEVKERKIRMQRRIFKEEPRKIVSNMNSVETSNEAEVRHQRIKELEAKLFKERMFDEESERVETKMDASNPSTVDDDEEEKRIQRHRRIKELEAKLNHKMADDECDVPRDEIEEQREERHQRIKELEAQLKFAATVVEESDDCEVPPEEPIVQSTHLSEERKREERHRRIKELEAKLKFENDECEVPPEEPIVERTQSSKERQREERHRRIKELEARLHQESTMVEEEDVCDTPEEPIMDRQSRIRELEEKLSIAAVKRKERQARRKSLQELEQQVRKELDSEGDDLLEQELEMMRLRAKMSSS